MMAQSMKYAYYKQVIWGKNSLPTPGVLLLINVYVDKQLQACVSQPASTLKGLSSEISAAKTGINR
jgi:hypothetical protein